MYSAQLYRRPMTPFEECRYLDSLDLETAVRKAVEDEVYRSETSWRVYVNGVPVESVAEALELTWSE